jgi:hypothetical protein
MIMKGELHEMYKYFEVKEGRGFSLQNKKKCNPLLPPGFLPFKN